VLNSHWTRLTLRFGKLITTTPARHLLYTTAVDSRHSFLRGTAAVHWNPISMQLDSFPCTEACYLEHHDSLRSGLVSDSRFTSSLWVPFRSHPPLTWAEALKGICRSALVQRHLLWLRRRLSDPFSYIRFQIRRLSLPKSGQSFRIDESTYVSLHFRSSFITLPSPRCLASCCIWNTTAQYDQLCPDSQLVHPQITSHRGPAD
jgi:hypothetical protein